MISYAKTDISVLSLFLPLIKGSFMEVRIDKIDVKRDHKELIALFYYIELKDLVRRLVYKQAESMIKYNTNNGTYKKRT